MSTITEEQNELVLVPATLDEVKKAVFSMHGDKSPGPDGLNPTFYQSFCHIVGVDVMNFCNQLIVEGVLPVKINHTLVCLITKSKQLEKM